MLLLRAVINTGAYPGRHAEQVLTLRCPPPSRPPRLRDATRAECLECPRDSEK